MRQLYLVPFMTLMTLGTRFVSILLLFLIIFMKNILDALVSMDFIHWFAYHIISNHSLPNRIIFFYAFILRKQWFCLTVFLRVNLELYNVSLVSTYVCNSGVWRPWPCWKGAKKLGNSCNCLWSYWRNCLAIAQQFFLSMRWKKGQPSLLFSRKKYMKFQSLEHNNWIIRDRRKNKRLRLSFSTYVGI